MKHTEQINAKSRRVIPAALTTATVLLFFPVWLIVQANRAVRDFQWG